MFESIHPGTTIGAAYLTVADLDRSLAYYQQGIGLQLQRRADDYAYLGVGGRDLLILREQSGGRSVQNRTGLYHFALLLPSRLELARTLHHLLASKTTIGGASDHAVSEALYLSDPDGHGIEIYRDRPRSEWQYSNGQLKMVTEPLDLEDLLRTHQEKERPWTGLHSDTIMGHIHLHVAHLTAAEAFYRDVLGFDLTARYGSAASFLSAGGYHHHIGINTWAGVGVPPPPADAVALQWFQMCLPDQSSLDQVIHRVRQAGLPIAEDAAGLQVRDPSENRIILTVNDVNS